MGSWKKSSNILLKILCVAAIAGGGLSCSNSSPIAYNLSPDSGLPPTVSQFGLRTAMRQLWEDHVVWTRVVIIDLAAGLPDTNAAVGRLLQNQVDIGNAIVPFYGKAAGDALAKLLHDHITIAAEIVTAAKAGDATKVSDAKSRWNANADQIAQFLAGANPNWSLGDLKTMMQMHLDQTLAEATARLGGDWAADIKAYDTVVSHILEMADTLSDGIAKQFPSLVP